MLGFSYLFGNCNEPPVFDRKVNLFCALFCNDNLSGEETEDLAAAQFLCIAASTVNCSWRIRWLTVAVCTWMVLFIVTGLTLLKMNRIL